MSPAPAPCLPSSAPAGATAPPAALVPVAPVPDPTPATDARPSWDPEAPVRWVLAAQPRQRTTGTSRPGDRGDERQRAPRGSRRPGEARPSGTRPSRPRPSGPAGTRPEGAVAATPQARVSALAQAVVQLWVEVESGRRTPRSVARLLDHGLYRRLQHRWVTGQAPGRVRRVSVQVSSADDVEVVAVVERDGRVGAVALRLRRRHDGWCLEEADRPEDRSRHVRTVTTTPPTRPAPTVAP